MTKLRAQEYIHLNCKTGDIKVKVEEITNEIDDIIETIISTATEGVMWTNKSFDVYAHDIDIWWGEADSRNKYSRVTVMKKCRVANF